MNSSIRNVLIGTFTLRFSTGLTGLLLVYFFADFEQHGGSAISPIVVGLFTALFFAAELVLSPPFGLLSDRRGFHRVMQYGPVFGAIAVVITGLVPVLLAREVGVQGATTMLAIALLVIGATRLLEGASTAASVPSILGYLAWATSDDEGLRGRVSARFELATLLGIGSGLAAAGILWPLLGPIAFFLNGVIYVGSLAIFRFAVAAPEQPVGPHHHASYGWQRYLNLLRTSHVWLLAPTWIAVNAAIGIYASQSIYALVTTPNPKFNDCLAPMHWYGCQLLAGGYQEWQITAGLLVAGIVFVLGIVWWGNRFKNYRRTTIILYGIGGGAVLVVGALLVNHALDVERLFGVSQVLPIVLALPAVAFGLFVLAGATPAALGLLADMSEAYPDDRGAIMGLYSVFLAIGQISGALIGGVASEAFAFDGILLATLLLLAIALAPLYQLRAYEHRFEAGPPTATA